MKNITLFKNNKKRRKHSPLSKIIFWAVIAVGIAVIGGDTFHDYTHDLPTDPTITSSLTTDKVSGTSQFKLCTRTARINCIVDGDTLYKDRVKIRISDIDTPETFSPKCNTERDLGKRATSRLIELVNSGPFEIVQLGARDTDRYGRKLRILIRDGRSLGDILVSEGLARTWSGKRLTWC